MTHLPRLSLQSVSALALFILLASSVMADDSGPYRGWDYLVKRLMNSGFSEQYLRSVFGDPRMPKHEEIPFSTAPKEREEMYADFLSKKKIDRGLNCLQANYPAFHKAEQLFNVSRFVIAAILLVETQCGDYTGKSLIINRLARMASLNEPDNVERNYKRLHALDDSVTLEQLEKRAAYLDTVFFPEVESLLKLNLDGRLNVFSLYGSYAGAFGLPQFLPGTYMRHAADGDRDGRVDLMNIHDAVWSIAHYLSAEGWNNKVTLGENRKVVWQYNHSEPYVDTVLKAAFLIEKQWKASH